MTAIPQYATAAIPPESRGRRRATSNAVLDQVMAAANTDMPAVVVPLAGTGCCNVQSLRMTITKMASRRQVKVSTRIHDGSVHVWLRQVAQ